MEASVKLLTELRRKFDEVREEVGFEPEYEEINLAFHLEDYVLSLDFVSPNFLRQLCSRIMDFFRDWHTYLNSLLVPNNFSFASQTESRLFNTEEDKREIWELMKISMRFLSMYSVIDLSGDKTLARDFINEGYRVWVEKFSPSLLRVLKRTYEAWKE